jgi:hypothetical protein
MISKSNSTCFCHLLGNHRPGGSLAGARTRQPRTSRVLYCTDRGSRTCLHTTTVHIRPPRQASIATLGQFASTKQCTGTSGVPVLTTATLGCCWPMPRPQPTMTSTDVGGDHRRRLHRDQPLDRPTGAVGGAHRLRLQWGCRAAASARGRAAARPARLVKVLGPPRPFR